VLDPNADLGRRSVTLGEEMFVLLLVLHLNTSIEVLKPGRLAKSDEALRKDIRWNGGEKI
jgi:hypothetical protein